MLLSAVSVLVVAQRSLEVPEGLMNNPVLEYYYDARTLPTPSYIPSAICWHYQEHTIFSTLAG
jgi:hypothetical protein